MIDATIVEHFLLASATHFGLASAAYLGCAAAAPLPAGQPDPDHAPSVAPFGSGHLLASPAREQEQA